MVTTAVHDRSSPRHTPWRQSLTAANTCAAVRRCFGRRLVPAGPPVEERKGGREGRERPGPPRIWVVPDPASRVAHARCLCPDYPDKRGPERVQIGAQLLTQIQFTIAPAVVLVIEPPRCRTVGSRTDGRSPLHTAAASPAETVRRCTRCPVDDAARRLVWEPASDGESSCAPVHQRTVTSTGDDSRAPGESTSLSFSGRSLSDAGHGWRASRGHPE